jgi:glycine hydroxymethyltransferase
LNIDNEVWNIIAHEETRQSTTLCLIASENLASSQVLSALGCVFTNKTVEGRPGKRYHRGAVYADDMERLAEKRACNLFDAVWANVQPHSCSQANQASLFALMRPGDTLLSMALKDGGHLSHGFSKNLSGQMYRVIHYGVCVDTFEIDYELVAKLAHEHRPKVIIVGASSYPRRINFELFHSIAHEIEACLLIDVAHFAGLIAGDQYPSPVPYADAVTMSTYKTLRGPRGGLIVSRNQDLESRVASAVFPGIQGTPCLSTIAAKAVCFGEACTVQFRNYAQQVLDNARAFASTLMEEGIDVVTKGTDSHIVLVDLRPLKITGRDAAEMLEHAGLICNMNMVPFDPMGSQVCSGLRFGLAGATTQGIGRSDTVNVARWVAALLKAMASKASHLNGLIEHTRGAVTDFLRLCRNPDLSSSEV